MSTVDYLFIDEQCYPVREMDGLAIQELYNISSISRMLDITSDFKINGYTIIENYTDEKLEFKEYNPYSKFLTLGSTDYYISEDANIAYYDNNTGSSGFVDCTIRKKASHDELFIVIGSSFSMEVSRLMVRTFYLELPSHYAVRFKDDNHLNCRLSNLYIEKLYSQCSTEKTIFDRPPTPFDGKLTDIGYIRFESSSLFDYYVNRNGKIIKISRQKGIQRDVRIVKMIKKKRIVIMIKKKRIPISRIVAESFIPNLPRSYTVKYKNGDYMDCSLKNLKIVSKEEA